MDYFQNKSTSQWQQNWLELFKLTRNLNICTEPNTDNSKTFNTSNKGNGNPADRNWESRNMILCSEENINFTFRKAEFEMIAEYLRIGSERCNYYIRKNSRL